ncbi:MAG: amino acid adenylation domain-containing protein, partial [Acidimicrobiales bacterium]
GAELARGYLNRPELTAERFVPSPFVEGDRLYKTGDLARYLPDGNIEFLGRNDFQVKIRGFRIELGEIEARLLEHESIRDAVVLAREDVSGEKRLVAYYVSHEGSAVSVESLRTHLLAALPEYMVPAAYVVLEALPLNANGKVDRKALPAPDGEAYATREYESPLGEVEETLAQIWCEVLKLDRVGRHDDFFELGGHSLLAVRVLSQMREQLRAEITLTQLFAHPVLCDIARLVSESKRQALSAIVRVDRSERLPVSFAQQRLWFLAQMDGVSQAYHIPFGLRLSGELDRVALGMALDRLVARHETLRTTFVTIEGEAYQRIGAPESGFALTDYDLRGHSDAGAELARLKAEEISAPFDLESGPLIRGRLIRVDEHEYELLLTMHHIVSDGWSMGVLLSELSTLYRAFCNGEQPVLPELPIQYADYAVWQRRELGGGVLQEQSAYWKRTLADAPPLHEVPTDRPRPAQQDYAGSHVGLALDAELTAGLKALSRRHGTTLFMTLLAAWSTLLGRLSGQEDVVIGTPVANRRRAEVEGLIGFFVNTLALRVDLSGQPSVSEVLARVKKQTLAAQEHQDVPFEQVVEVVAPPRSLSHAPLFQVLFAWQNNERGELALPGLSINSAGAAASISKFDLTLNLFEAGDRIVGEVEYATSLFERSTVERYLSYLHRLLQAMVADDGQHIGQLPMLPDAERHRVLVEWNATEREYPSDRCIQELFEAQVAASPDAVAVVHEREQLTYGELNARANQLAHYLHEESGVKPGDRVALTMRRSSWLICAELAIVKCGATYVPIDEAMPAERQRFVLDDCGIAVLLSLQGQEVAESPGVRRIDLDALSLAEHAAANLGVTSDAPAYVMYTSGSTGEPKGAVIPHCAITRLVCNSGYARFGPGDRVAFAANPAFDASTMEVWAPLLNGGSTVVIDRDTVLEPTAFKHELQKQQVNVLWLTVGLFNQYADALGEVFSSLRYLIVGGDALDVDVIRRVLRNGAPKHLLNGYGPTETTTFAATYEITDVPQSWTSVPIGRPIGNTRIYIVDAHGEPVPVGVAGEVCIGGAGVALGYLNRPELTAERFVPSPFVEGDRLYKTGDLARYLPDGNIEFLGRNDF